MTIPSEIVGTYATLAPVYSGDPSISRRRGTTTEGQVRTLDIIQSLPKNGRSRHVVRMTFQDAPPAPGVKGDGVTITVTMDHPEGNPGFGSGAYEAMHTTIGTLMDEVALGQM